MKGKKYRTAVCKEGQHHRCVAGTIGCECDCHKPFRADVCRICASLVKEIQSAGQELKEIFLWRDGVPHYRTPNGVPQEIPPAVRRQILALLARLSDGASAVEAGRPSQPTPARPPARRPTR